MYVQVMLDKCDGRCPLYLCACIRRAGGQSFIPSAIAASNEASGLPVGLLTLLKATLRGVYEPTFNVLVHCNERLLLAGQLRRPEVLHHIIHPGQRALPSPAPEHLCFWDACECCDASSALLCCTLPSQLPAVVQTERGNVHPVQGTGIGHSAKISCG